MAAFRTISITHRCKLESQLNYLVIRGETETKINLDEITTLIIANTQCSMTAACLSQLIDHKVKVIFCDPQWNPQAELIGYHDHYSSYGTLMKQLAWKKEAKSDVWQAIIKAKLVRQSMVLSSTGDKIISKVLLDYAEQVEPDDISNREGLGAKQYFQALFGLGFNRKNPTDRKNAYLNYGYSMLLSAVNREIASSGYLMQLGIHHIGDTNPFNLGCDLMEPLRPFVDIKVVTKEANDETFKKVMPQILKEEVGCSDKVCLMENAIHIYVKSILSALETGDVSKCQFVYPITK